MALVKYNLLRDNKKIYIYIYLQEREQLLKAKKKETATNIPLSLKYNRTLPKIKEIVMKHWHLLHIKSNLAEIFQNLPILAFRRNKNLRDIIGTKLIENGKVKRKFTNKIQGKCTPCLANNRTLCCKQIVDTTTFRSNQTNRFNERTFDLITTEKMYGNQMLYLQAAIFQAKTITSTHMQNSY